MNYVFLATYWQTKIDPDSDMNDMIPQCLVLILSLADHIIDHDHDQFAL